MGMSDGMSDIVVREAVEADAPGIFSFIIELAEYEHAREEVVTDVEGIRRSLFGPDARAYALIAEVDGRAAGYAVYFYSYSTWLGQYGIYLEDLYVTPDYRGRGAGKALLKRVARIAVDNNCGRYEWSVLNWNRPAIEFYESVGARPRDEWTTYRLTGEALKRLAE